MMAIIDSSYDLSNKKDLRWVKEFNRSLFVNRGFIAPTIALDLDSVKVAKADLEWIIDNAVVNVLFVSSNIRDLKISESHFKKLKVLRDENKYAKTIFEILDEICYNKDRQAVLKQLNNTRPNVVLLFNWLASNVGQLGEVNRKVLEVIDMRVLLKKSEDWFYEMLAFGFKPVRDKIFYKYKMTKVEESNVQ